MTAMPKTMLILIKSVSGCQFCIKRGLVDAVDAFCENIAFNKQQVKKSLRLLNRWDCLSNYRRTIKRYGGGALVASFDGLSADHIEYLSDDSIQRMAQSGTVGVLLPTAFYVLKETQLPPIDKMRQQRRIYGNIHRLQPRNIAVYFYFAGDEHGVYLISAHARRGAGRHNIKRRQSVGIAKTVKAKLPLVMMRTLPFGTLSVLRI